jgi:hypothetical protein
MGCFFILASLLLICTAMKSQAAPIVFDSFRVFDQYHNLKYSRSVTNEQQEINGAGTIYFLEVPGIGDPDEWGNYTSVMQSPSDQTMSDAFGVLFRDPDFLLFFLSDTSTDPCPYPLGPNLVFEHLLPSGGYGGMFDATMYLDHGLQAQGWSATFSSGLTVPEPATFFLLGSGVGVIALLKRRSIKI